MSETSQETLGWYEGSEDCIYIYSGLEGAVFSRVLLHEIAHAILHIGGVSNLLNRKQEEAVCDAMEAFSGLFQDKKFVEYMNE